MIRGPRAIGSSVLLDYFEVQAGSAIKTKIYNKERQVSADTADIETLVVIDGNLPGTFSVGDMRLQNCCSQRWWLQS